ncbi:MAG: MotA/TolQ/ExbB proton channel family protein [Nitrospiraceae bacterium]|nr:MotA/TolQ/ExbB proton channel family protein [Nitrospiraceae bacterium]
MEISPLQMILQAGALVKTILSILFTFSVVSWAIIFYKFRYLSKAEKQNGMFVRALSSGDAKGILHQAKLLETSPAANLYRSAYAEAGNPGALKRVLKSQEVMETGKLESHLNFLATTGSTTPFIGLFGTVWGIMNSFSGIGMRGSASLAVVAPGIAEALIATAFGLAAAIPAVIAYNYYLGRTRRIISEMESISEEIEALLEVRP